MSLKLSPADMGIPNYEGTFLDFLGFHVTDTATDFVRMRMPMRREHTNTMAMAHGGVVMAMLDIAGAFSAHQGKTEQLVSITMTQSTNFLRSVTGDWLVAEGRVIRRTRNMVFTESRVLDPSHGDDPSEQICATAQCTFKMKKRQPTQEAGAI